MRNSCFLILLLYVATACNGALDFLSRKSPSSQYAEDLNESDIASAPIVREWLLKRSEVVTDPPMMQLPFRIKGAFFAKEISALAWQFEIRQGTVLRVQLKWNSPESSRLFLDLIRPDQKKSEAYLSGSDTLLQHEVSETGIYVLRLQPELFGRGHFSISVIREPAYAVFPVWGQNSKDIWSFWGDARDDGSRAHEGIDIFAPRGTAVISPVNGRVTSVRNGGLGGKSVFVRDQKRSHSLYFAHLDSQFVADGQQLVPGDTIGLVGNTGNAKHTRPHLHFGIYTGYTGAVDPYPFVYDLDKIPDSITANMPESIYMRVRGSQANMRSGPGTTFTKLGNLRRSDVLKVFARTTNWYLVHTPTGEKGFIHHSLLEEAKGKPGKTGEYWVFWNPFEFPADSISLAVDSVEIIGKYNNFELLQIKEGGEVWRRVPS